jgi:drug/metabolite transporter (DMT)-like permease
VIILQQVIASGTFLAAKVALRDIPPLDMAFMRFLIAAAILWPLGERRRRGRPIDRADQWKLWGLGLLAIPLNQGLFLYGLQWTTAGHSALLYALTPMAVLLLAAWRLGERITVWRTTGVLIAFAGVVVVLLEKGIVLSPSQFLGDLLVLIAMVAWAYYTVLGKPLIKKYGAVVVTARAMTYGTLLFIPIGAWSISDFVPAAVAPDAWLGLLYCAIMTSVIAYILWFWALKFIDASQVAVFNNVQPIVAAFFAWLLLGEPLTTAFVGGGVLVLIGVIITEKL